MNRTPKPLVIPVFIPHSGCPHQCAFCNQKILTSQAHFPDEKSIIKTIRHYLAFKGNRTRVEVAFFGGNFLGLESEKVLFLLNGIMPHIRSGEIDSIRFSTRPDTVSDATLDLISDFPVGLVEIGVQSMTEGVLLASKRGHTRQDTSRSFELLKKRGYRTGAQLMLGLPGETETSLLDSTKKAAELLPDVARIYPLLVLKGSRLETWYKEGTYIPLTLEKSVCLAGQMVRILRDAGIDVIRVGLQASDLMANENMVLSGPWHPAFGHLVFSGMMYETVCDRVKAVCRISSNPELILQVHPGSESRLRGNKNTNMKQLAARFPDRRFFVRRDEQLAADEVRVEPAS